MSSDLNSADPIESGRPPLAPFEQQLAAARPDLLAFARRIAVEEAEDLCQETLARALRYRSSFDMQRPLLPWLKVSLMRAYADQARKSARRARECAHESEPQMPSPGPEVRNARRVARLLDTLAPLDAQLLRGFHLEEQSIAQLALATGLAEGSVRSRLHRTRQRLATQALEEGEGL